MIGYCVERGVEFRIYEILRSLRLIKTVVVWMEMLRFAPGDGVERRSKSQAFDHRVGIITESSRAGFDLMGSAFNMCACQMVHWGLLVLPVSLSSSYW